LHAEPAATLDFNLEKNGVHVLPQFLQYEVVEGHNVKLGEVSFDLDHCAPNFGPEIEANDALYALHFAWPTHVVPHGQLTIRDFYTDSLLYTTPLLTLGAPPDSVAANTPGAPLLHIKAAEQSVGLDKLLGQKEERRVRFCIESKAQEFNSSLCSRPYRLVLTKRGYIFFEVTEKKAPSVKFNWAAMPLSGRFSFSDNDIQRIEIVSNIQQRFQFEIKAINSSYDSLYRGEVERMVLYGHGTLPATNVLEGTEKKWRADLSLKEPVIYFREPNGFLIKQGFSLDSDPPPEEARTFIDTNTRSSTYLSHFHIHGKTREVDAVSSTERGAELSSSKEYDWDFDSSLRNQINKREIDFLFHSGIKRKGNYEVFRGQPYEGSVNIQSAMVSDSGTTPLFIDFKGSAWFEQVLKSENLRWSLHRWGVHLDALTTLVDAANQYGHTVGFTAIEGSLQYNLMPGLWSSDPLYGPTLTYESVKFNATSASILGLGGFWSEPLPQFKPFNSSPKWLEIRGNYYFLPVGSMTILTPDFDISANLKVFFKPDYFGQVGLEYRAFNFINQSDNIIVQTNALLFSLGGGIQF